jgi:mannonate dehydratase
VTRDIEGNFCEDYFFNGDVDMFEVVKALVKEELKRTKESDGVLIPVRPDHGNLMFDDIGKKFKSGYSLYGRMKGLAEIRGLEIGIKRSLESESMGSN